MEKSLIPFIKALLFGIATVVVIPRQFYKKLFIYGFIFGAIVDAVVILVLGRGFHLFKYYGMGPFSVYGWFSFWTPIAWMFAFMLFSIFYLSEKSFYLYTYLALHSLDILSASFWKGLKYFDI